MLISFLSIFCIFQLFTSISLTTIKKLDEIRPIKEHPAFDEFFESSFENQLRILNEIPQGGRIYNGIPAKLGQFPYQVFIVLNDGKKQYCCGGALIKLNLVVTAAHCLSFMISGTVYAGVADFTNSSLNFTVNFTKSDMIIHENFTIKGTKRLNDIGLIKLQNSFPCHRNLGVIDLPCGCDFMSDLENEELTVAGFGLRFDNDAISPVMNYIKYNGAMPNCKCASLTNIEILENMLCTAIVDGKTTCSGDSGSPLTAFIHGRPVLVGIVSFGTSRTCSTTVYDGFTRVSSYVDWIQEKIILIIKSNIKQQEEKVHLTKND
ncbi:hypothetical protein PVAND_015490 [Polypedilum vanderplanki]|uniref:Peptidase S1 domain-containing protein n=1 Tax=Polypedilum vanderplanki TaxID=319348 RepID=A0A9J6BCZ6_POLVA|nr:hypothetical protein PVAND_015490 [Polypedilum vanderplanki]